MRNQLRDNKSGGINIVYRIDLSNGGLNKIKSGSKLPNLFKVPFSHCTSNHPNNYTKKNKFHV